MRAALAAAAIALTLGAAPAFGCGICVEDKIAGAYDHAVVARALGRKHHVAFFHIDGGPVQGESSRRALQALADSAAGVDKGSARVSVDSATLSVAFDPARTSFGAVHKMLERKLSARKLALVPLKIMQRPAELKAAGR